jgi:hypothetical protein
LVALCETEHNLLRAIEKLVQDVKLNEERHNKQLGEINGLIRASMKDILTHKCEVNAITSNMGVAAEKCLKETEERILNNPLN